ncbi:MAG: bifunctional UDP-3-O-[Bacteroidales bacterium]|nr:bifunctional UDP-3-O-[3-hydroxymyristoyl] N-acetylglucosamine deacetylase/3-hydroxyacyl-ACP dehydratase [Bacteroidales bacterium]
MEKQTTIKNNIKISGRGLHTGQVVNVQLLPSAADTGVVFRRTDIEGVPEIPALVSYVGDTSRGTTLCKNGVRIATIEHLLSALVGLNVDNLIVELDGEEIPILDGSPRYWVEEIKKVGIAELDKERKYITLKENITYTDAQNGIEIIGIPADDFKVTTYINYKTKVLGEQTARYSETDDYETELSKCRTFVFLHEIEFLQKANLIKGGDVDNALIFVNKELGEDDLNRLATLFNKDIAKLDVHEGILNNVQKHFDNEPARHKLLDFIGDLSLIGGRIKGHFFTSCPGHKSNVEFAKLIKNHVDMSTNPKVPVYDPNQTPVYDINAIKGLLPHRYPFLMIDKIIEVGDDYIVGIKNVTGNEAYFQGHFPEQPVMPGVLQVEAMAQTGGILVLKDVPDPENYSTYFAKIDNVKFKRPVVPGDTLVIKLRVTAPLRRTFVEMDGEVYVGNTLVSSASMMAQVIKNKNN